MMKLFSAALVAATFATVPAIAQSSSSAQPSSSMSSAQQTGSGGQSSARMGESQQKIRDTLNKAGFSDVQILDTAYLVQATTESNETVMMVVNAAAQPNAQSSSSQSSGNSDQNQSTN